MATQKATSCQAVAEPANGSRRVTSRASAATSSWCFSRTHARGVATWAIQAGVAHRFGRPMGSHKPQVIWAWSPSMQRPTVTDILKPQWLLKDAKLEEEHRRGCTRWVVRTWSLQGQDTCVPSAGYARRQETLGLAMPHPLFLATSLLFGCARSRAPSSGETPSGLAATPSADGADGTDGTDGTDGAMARTGRDRTCRATTFRPSTSTVCWTHGALQAIADAHEPGVLWTDTSRVPTT